LITDAVEMMICLIGFNFIMMVISYWLVI